MGIQNTAFLMSVVLTVPNESLEVCLCSFLVVTLECG